MFLTITLLIIGLIISISGAEVLVRASVKLAKSFGVSDFVIGLTIIGMGTSMPELVVSLIGDLRGNSNIAIGNVIGSNIINIFVILGLTAMLLEIPMTKTNIKRDLPINFLGTIIFLFIVILNKYIFNTSYFGFFSALPLLFLFIFYMYKSFKNPDKEEFMEDKTIKTEKISIILQLSFVFIGLVALIFGASLFVDKAKELAYIAGMSDKFVALTIVAGGTSMPEILTCIVAAFKKRAQLALGNLIGSNIFNLLFILSGAAILKPINTVSVSLMDYTMLLLSAVIPFLFIYLGKKRCIDKLNGLLLILVEIGYFTYLTLHLKG